MQKWSIRLVSSPRGLVAVACSLEDRSRLIGCGTNTRVAVLSDVSPFKTVCQLLLSLLPLRTAGAS